MPLSSVVHKAATSYYLDSLTSKDDDCRFGSCNPSTVTRRTAPAPRARTAVGSGTPRNAHSCTSHAGIGSDAQRPAPWVKAEQTASWVSVLTTEADMPGYQADVSLHSTPHGLPAFSWEGAAAASMGYSSEQTPVASGIAASFTAHSEAGIGAAAAATPKPQAADEDAAAGSQPLAEAEANVGNQESNAADTQSCTSNEAAPQRKRSTQAIVIDTIRNAAANYVSASARKSGSFKEHVPLVRSEGFVIHPSLATPGANSTRHSDSSHHDTQSEYESAGATCGRDGVCFPLRQALPVLILLASPRCLPPGARVALLQNRCLVSLAFVHHSSFL